MKKYLAAISAAFILAGCGADGANPSQKEKPEESKEKEATAAVEKEKSPDYVKTGENGVMKEDVIMGVKNKENLDEIVNFASKNNKEAIAEMIVNGKALLVEKGTPYTVVDAGIMRSKIRVNGVDGYIPVEFTEK